MTISFIRQPVTVDVSSTKREQGASAYAGDSAKRTPYDCLTSHGGRTGAGTTAVESFGKRNHLLSVAEYNQLESRLQLTPQSVRRELARKEGARLNGIEQFTTRKLR